MQANVPNDFPHGVTAATVPGSQAKFLAREIDGRYVVGMTQEELCARWAYCEDLAQQLAERTRRKAAAGLITDLEDFYRKTEQRVNLQGWDLNHDEVFWLMKRTRELADATK